MDDLLTKMDEAIRKLKISLADANDVVNDPYKPPEVLMQALINTQKPICLL